jgi:protein-tyrosine kinase
MSKIENALNKALIIRGELASTDMSPLLESSKSVMTVGGETASSQDIACMIEPYVYERRELAHKPIIYPEMADNPVLNSFRQLRTRLLQQSEDRNMVLMVTSVRSGSGGSFIALNLAVALSANETKTALLMDCNLRNNGFAGLLYSKNELGLIDYLEQGMVGIEEIIQPSGIPRLRWIPAGRRRGIITEALNSPKMRNLLQSLKYRHDDRQIIVDAPPITQSADAEILVDFCDYVLLVVPYGKATESQILAAAMNISEEKLLGVVFNNAPR